MAESRSNGGPITLAIDIGGSGLKALTLGPRGKALTDRVRVPTPYPLPPSRLVKELQALVAPLGSYDRVSAGFPGMVRSGVVLTAPNLSLAKGPGSEPDPKVVKAWSHFDLDAALTAALGKPTRVVNDADLQGLDAAVGRGLEIVITLGTGFGTAVLHDGQLLPHMEIAHHPFRHDETYDQQVGDVALRSVGPRRWSKRVHKAIAALDTMFVFDHLYIGGGNAKHLRGDLPEKVSLIDSNSGLLGGIRLWQQHHHLAAPMADR